MKIVKFEYKELKTIVIRNNRFFRRGKEINPHKDSNKNIIKYNINKKYITYSELIYILTTRNNIHKKHVYVKGAEYHYKDFTIIPHLKGVELDNVKGTRNTHSSVRGLIRDGKMVLINGSYRTEFIPLNKDDYEYAYKFLIDYENKDIAPKPEKELAPIYKDIRGHKGYSIDRNGIVVDDRGFKVSYKKVVNKIPFYILRGKREFDVGKLILLGWDRNYHLQTVIYKDLDNIHLDTISYSNIKVLHGGRK